MRKELENYLVVKYPKILSRRYKPVSHSNMGFGFDHRDGWFWILDQLFSSIQFHVDNNNRWSPDDKKINQVVATQIKEKFGGLCVYFSGGDDVINGMVSYAESLSHKTCEYCGTMKNVGSTTGWVSICCEDCHNNVESLNRLSWEKHKDDLPLKAQRKLKLMNLNN